MKSRNTKIIAEFCQNHLGQKKILENMIYAAAHNGAEYGKIQSIRVKNLTYRKKFEEGKKRKKKIITIKRKFVDEINRLKQLELSIKDEEWFIKVCNKAGIKPMTTVFAKSTIDEIKDLGFYSIKVASYDCASVPLIKKLQKNFLFQLVQLMITK